MRTCFSCSLKAISSAGDSSVLSSLIISLQEGCQDCVFSQDVELCLKVMVLKLDGYD